MLSRPQQILIKCAQREAALDDTEYREALEVVSGCRSSKDPRLTDRHLDLLLGFFEAIYWRKVDALELQPPCKPDAVFRQRGFWASRNTRQENSRDRFAIAHAQQEISAIEQELARLGFGQSYTAAIREKVTASRADAYALNQYRAALQRTLRAKQKRILVSG
jgi:hypothetical protein